jgi:tRNA (guanine37-N1)-methyltransferase
MPAKDDAAPASGGGQGRRLDVFSLFPAAFDWYLSQVHVRRAADLGTRIAVWNYRDFTPLRHLQVDDTPFGGGAGMVLRIDVVAAALEAVYGVDCEQVRQQCRVIELTPKGR